MIPGARPKHSKCRQYQTPLCARKRCTLVGLCGSKTSSRRGSCLVCFTQAKGSTPQRSAATVAGALLGDDAALDRAWHAGSTLPLERAMQLAQQ